MRSIPNIDRFIGITRSMLARWRSLRFAESIRYRNVDLVRLSGCEKFCDENATTPILTPYNIRIT
jgi:hypothetical protein